MIIMITSIVVYIALAVSWNTRTTSPVWARRVLIRFWVLFDHDMLVNHEHSTFLVVIFATPLDEHVGANIVIIWDWNFTCQNGSGLCCWLRVLKHNQWTKATDERWVRRASTALLSIAKMSCTNKPSDHIVWQHDEQSTSVRKSTAIIATHHGTIHYATLLVVLNFYLLFHALI